MNREVKFVDALPESERSKSFWEALDENPGTWAEWWSPNPASVYNAAKQQSRNGRRYEAAIRRGKAYVRAVSR